MTSGPWLALSASRGPPGRPVDLSVGRSTPPEPGPAAHPNPPERGSAGLGPAADMTSGPWLALSASRGPPGVRWSSLSYAQPRRNLGPRPTRPAGTWVRGARPRGRHDEWPLARALREQGPPGVRWTSLSVARPRRNLGPRPTRPAGTWVRGARPRGRHDEWPLARALREQGPPRRPVDLSVGRSTPPKPGPAAHPTRRNVGPRGSAPRQT